MEEDAIYDAEDDSRSANAQCKGANRDESEVIVFAKVAEGVEDIHEKVFNGWPPPHRAAVLFDQRYVSKFAAVGGRSFSSSHASGNQLLNLLFKVLLNLFRKLAVEPAS